MPVISFASPKGGAGKTTAAILLASELARKGAGVTLIDCDPRQWCVKWAEGGKTPEALRVLAKVDEDKIIDVIEAEAVQSPFVIVDLEGTNSQLVAYAMSRSNLVIIPTQAGPMEGDSAADAIKLVKQQERAFRVRIPFAVLMTRMSAAIRSRIEKELTEQMESADIPVFETQLIERNAFKSMFAYKCSLDDLPASTYKLEDAKVNARAFSGEVLSMFKAAKAEQQKEAVV
jgi:chromosome partitioning protein